MSTRYTRSVLAATIVTCAFAGWGSRTAIASDDKMPVTAVGCLQSEREYRRQHESSKFAGTGYGLNDEYVLIDAVIGGPSSTSSRLPNRRPTASRAVDPGRRSS